MTQVGTHLTCSAEVDLQYHAPLVVHLKWQNSATGEC